MATQPQISPATAVLDGECRYCGRDFEPELNGACPAEDDCPSHFEAIGKHHPDHPDEQLGDPYAEAA